MALAERIKILVDLEGSQTDFSNKTGIKRGTLSRVLVTGSGLTSTTLEQIAAAYPDLNLHWLLLGTGEMWSSNNQDDHHSEQEQDPEEDKQPEQHQITMISGQTFITNPEQTLLLMNELMLKRIRELEREMKLSDPERAKRLGID